MFEEFLSNPNSSMIIYMAVLGVFVLGLIAQARVKSVYKKYLRVGTQCGLTADQVAGNIARDGGAASAIIPINGTLTDRYDPRDDTVGLSNGVYGGRSVSAYAIAAHEVGHAIQHSEGYLPIKIRNMILPVAQIGSSAAPWLVILGVLMSFPILAEIGVFLFLGVLLFQLVTLPVELNASRRAMTMLTDGGYISGSERKGARKVLTAAAMTYVVAVLSSLVSFLRLLLIAASARGRRD